MTILQATSLVLRRGGRAVGALIFALIFGTLVATGFFEPSGGEALTVSRSLVFGLWLLVFCWRGYDRLHRRNAKKRQRLLMDLELGLLLVVVTHAVVRLTGGVESPAYPLVYILVAFLVSFLPWRPVVVLVIATLGLEALALWLAETPGVWSILAAHSGFIAAFALLNVIFTRSELEHLRRSRKQKLAEVKDQAEQTARDFRLMAAPSTEGAITIEPREQEERRTLSAVMELHQSIYFALDMLKKSLQLHTAALLWLDGKGRLRIAELVSDSESIDQGPFNSSPGVLGAALACGHTVNLHHLRGQLAEIPYYQTKGQVGALLAVPVCEGGMTRGVLCADRVEVEPFGEREIAALHAAARYMVQVVENERVFVSLERAKDEQTKLFKASEMLGTSGTENDAIDAVLEAAQGIAPYDFAAVTLYNAARGRHKVVRAVGEGAPTVEGLTFNDNAGLASMAVKNRHYLPYRGEFDSKRQVVYTKGARLKGMESLLILPLVAQDVPMGTLTLASRTPGVFTDTVRRTLQVLTNQMAVSVTNSRMVRQLKEMATTDGLTGLLNHRVFQEELEKKTKSAERFGHDLSVILTDLDKFKSVNDTYGHPVGDVVLRKFSEVLQNAMRETDLVARYGGEEFVVICEQTDARGALNLANRIREEMAKLVFQSEIGEFRVTCSLGIASFPMHTKEKAKIVELADQALYVAKERGRNRAEVHRGMVTNPLAKGSSRSSAPPPSTKTKRSSAPPRPSVAPRPTQP